jgi:hypothetical protein
MLVSCLLLQPWRWRLLVPPKRRITFNGLYRVISQKLKFLFQCITLEYEANSKLFLLRPIIEAGFFVGKVIGTTCMKHGEEHKRKCLGNARWYYMYCHVYCRRGLDSRIDLLDTKPEFGLANHAWWSFRRQEWLVTENAPTVWGSKMFYFWNNET